MPFSLTVFLNCAGKWFVRLSPIDDLGPVGKREPIAFAAQHSHCMRFPGSDLFMPELGIVVNCMVPQILALPVCLPGCFQSLFARGPLVYLFFFWLSPRFQSGTNSVQVLDP